MATLAASNQAHYNLCYLVLTILHVDLYNHIPQELRFDYMKLVS